MINWRLLGGVALASLCGLGTARADLFEEIDVVASDLNAANAARRKDAVDRLATQPLAQARPLLIQAFDDVDTDVKARATVVAGKRQLLELVPRITDRLTAPDAKLRAAAAEALAQLAPKTLADNPSIAAALERTLADTDGDVRFAALTALLRLPESRLATAIDAVARAIEDERPAVRLAAVEGAGRIRHRQLLVPLLGRLADPAREVRAAALEALANINDPKVASALMRQASEGPDEIRQQALMALGRLGAPSTVSFLRQMLVGGPDKLRPRAAQALALCGRRDPALAAGLAVELTALLRREDLRPTVSEALLALGPAAAAALGDELARPATSDPELLVRLLDQLQHESAAPPLLAELRRGRVRRDLLARALGHIPVGRAPETAAALVGLLSDEEEATRRAAVRALEGHTDERAISVLQDLVDSRDAEVALFAVRELGRLGAKSALPRLLAALGRGEPRFTAAAAEALGRLGDASATARLEPLLGANEQEVRAAAARAIARLADPQIVPSLCRRLRVGSGEAIPEILIALEGPLRGRPDGVAREVLLGLAEKRRAPTAEAALAVLAAMHDGGAAVRLDAIAQNRANAASTRAAAVRALAGLPDAGPRLAALLMADVEEEVRLEAAWALRLHPSEKAALTATAQHAPSLLVRQNAQSALAWLAVSPKRSPSFVDVLVEDADGSKRPGVRYRIDYSDGTKRIGRSDATGSVHDEQIPPGKFRLTILD